MGFPQVRVAHQGCALAGSQAPVPAHIQVSQPVQVHQEARLVHYQEVSGLLFLLHRPDHLHRHRLRLQREPVKIHRAPCTGARNHLRLLRQLRALFCQPLQCAVRVRGGHSLHHQAGKQFRNHRHPGVRRFIQAAPPPIHDYLRAALSPLLRALSLRHSPRNRHQAELRDDVQEQEEEYQCRECTAAGRQGSDCLYAALRQQHETRLRILSRQVPGQETCKPPYSDGHPVRHHFRQQVSLATEQLENPQAPGHEGAYYERSPEGHHHHDGTYRPGLFQGSAGNLHQS